MTRLNIISLCYHIIKLFTLFSTHFEWKVSLANKRKLSTHHQFNFVKVLRTQVQICNFSYSLFSSFLWYDSLPPWLQSTSVFQFKQFFLFITKLFSAIKISLSSNISFERLSFSLHSKARILRMERRQTSSTKCIRLMDDCNEISPGKFESGKIHLRAELR